MSLSRCNYRINDLGGRCQLLQGHDGGIHDVEAEVRRRVAEALAPRRADRDFTDRLSRRIEEDLSLLEAIERGPDRVERLAETVDDALARRRQMLAEVMRQIVALPMGLYVGANRYDTDDQHVLHLWSQDGRSFDVTWPKDPPAGSPEGHIFTQAEADAVRRLNRRYLDSLTERSPDGNQASCHGYCIPCSCTTPPTGSPEGSSLAPEADHG